MAIVEQMTTLRKGEGGSPWYDLIYDKDRLKIFSGHTLVFLRVLFILAG